MDVREEEAVEECIPLHDFSQRQPHVSQEQPEAENGGHCCAWMSRYAKLSFFNVILNTPCDPNHYVILYPRLNA